MILEAILTLTIIAAVASVVNLFDKKIEPVNVIPMESRLPNNLPIIALFNKEGLALNFLVDSGSNISHICPEYYDQIDAQMLGEYKEGEIEGLGATNKGITMCKAKLYDMFNREFVINLSVSEAFATAASKLEKTNGVKLHGLLGTDFLTKYEYVVDFKSLEIYTKKKK